MDNFTPFPSKSFPSKLKNLPHFKEISLKNVFEQNTLKRSAIISSGGYLEQDIYSIIASKIYDIEQNNFCFWAHRYFNAAPMKKIVYNFFNATHGDKYLIMTCTHNKKYEQGNTLNIENNEPINLYHDRMWDAISHSSNSYIKEYKYFNDNIWLQFPDTMFPAIVSNDASNQGIAYLISEFSYSTEKMEETTFKSSFKQRVQLGWENECTYANRPTHRLIELKPESSLLNSPLEKSDEITFVIAKLKAPYITEIKW